MNVFQKISVLIVRIVGCGVAIRALVEPLYFSVLSYAGQTGRGYTGQTGRGFVMELWMPSILLFLVGTVLVLASKPIGTFLGFGLDEDHHPD